MSVHIHVQQVVIHQPSARSIRPDMTMDNPDFLKGYTIGLRDNLRPELTEENKPLTDEDMIESLKKCVIEEPELLPYILGNHIGSIIAKCH